MSTRFSQSNMEMSRLTRDGTAETVSRDQILWRERGQGKAIHNVGDKPTVILDQVHYISHSAYWSPTRKNYFVVVV